MVTAAASDRGAGSDPVTRAVPAPENAWTVPTVTGDPPPKTSARPPDVTPAPSCSGALSVPIRRAAPVAVRTAYTPLADVPAGVSPPSTMSWPGDPGTTTARLSGAARCHGSKPDSAASRPGGAAAARTRGRPVPCVLAPPCGRIANHPTTATTTTATVATTARLRRTRADARAARHPPPAVSFDPGMLAPTHHAVTQMTAP